MIHLGGHDPQLDGIWLSPSMERHTSNVYVMDGGRTLIDAGNTSDILRELDAQFPAGVGGVERIVLTHPHYDHVGGLGRLLFYCDADIYLHAAAFAYTFLGDASLPEIAGRAGTLDKLIPLQDGQLLAIGAFDLEVIYTPGHTPGGICLYHRAGQTLFSQDLVFPSTDDHVRLSEPDLHTGNWDQLIDSLQRLMGLPAERLLPGHFAPVLADGRQLVETAFFETVRRVRGEYAAWVRTAAALADHGRLEEALAYYDGALTLQSDSVGARLSKALVLTELGRFEAALPLFDAVLAAEPDLEDAQVGKGFALLGVGHTAEALKLEPLRRALALSSP